MIYQSWDSPIFNRVESLIMNRILKEVSRFQETIYKLTRKNQRYSPFISVPFLTDSLIIKLAKILRNKSNESHQYYLL